MEDDFPLVHGVFLGQWTYPLPLFLPLLFLSIDFCLTTVYVAGIDIVLRGAEEQPAEVG